MAPKRVSARAESDLARETVEFIARVRPDYICIRMQSGRVRARNGWMQLAPGGTPDRLIVRPNGRVVWLEFKRGDERLNPVQVEMHARLRALGHRVIVVRDVQDVVPILVYQVPSHER